MGIFQLVAAGLGLAAAYGIYTHLEAEKEKPEATDEKPEEEALKAAQKSDREVLAALVKEQKADKERRAMDKAIDDRIAARAKRAE